MLLPYSTGYQGINRVLKALRGGRNGGFLERGKGEIWNDGETKKRRREGEWSGRERWMYIWSVSLLYCHSVLGFASDTRTDNKWVGSEYKGRLLPPLPLVTRRH